MRLVHLSPSKQFYPMQYPGWKSEAALLHCPLLRFLVSVSMGEPDLALARLMAAASVDAWEQAVGDFMPN